MKCKVESPKNRSIPKNMFCQASDPSFLLEGSPFLEETVQFGASEWAVTLASSLRHSIWSGKMGPNLKSALIVSHTPWHQSARACMNLRNPFLLHLSANDPIEVLAQRLNEWQPDSIGGYPSVMNALAAEQLEGRLHMHPKIITVSSELLTEEMRQRIETV